MTQNFEETRLSLISPRDYRALIEAFVVLAEGGSQPFDVIFKNPNVFAQRVMQILINQKVCSHLGGQIRLENRDLLNQFFNSEKLFCALGGWDDSHYAHVDTLLRRGSLTQEAAAVMALCGSDTPLMPRTLLAERVRYNRGKLERLSVVASLPVSVQLLMEQEKVGAHRAYDIRKAGNESAMLEAVRNFARREIPDYENASSGAGEDLLESDESDIREIAATTLKLCAALYEAVRSIEKKVSNICSELGVRERP